MNFSKARPMGDCDSETVAFYRREINGHRNKCGSLYMSTLDPIMLALRKAFEALGEIIDPDYNPIHLKYSLNCLKRDLKTAFKHDTSIDQFRDVIYGLLGIVYKSLNWHVADKERRMKEKKAMEELLNAEISELNINDGGNNNVTATSVDSNAEEKHRDEEIPTDLIKLNKTQQKMRARFFEKGGLYEKNYTLRSSPCRESLADAIEKSCIILMKVAGDFDVHYLEYLLCGLDNDHDIALQYETKTDELHALIYRFIESLSLALDSVREEKRRRMSKGEEGIGQKEEGESGEGTVTKEKCHRCESDSRSSPVEKTIEKSE